MKININLSHVTTDEIEAAINKEITNYGYNEIYFDDHAQNGKEITLRKGIKIIKNYSAKNNEDNCTITIDDEFIIDVFFFIASIIKACKPIIKIAVGLKDMIKDNVSRIKSENQKFFEKWADSFEYNAVRVEIAKKTFLVGVKHNKTTGRKQTVCTFGADCSSTDLDVAGKLATDELNLGDAVHIYIIGNANDEKDLKKMCEEFFNNMVDGDDNL